MINKRITNRNFAVRIDDDRNSRIVASRISVIANVWYVESRVIARTTGIVDANLPSVGFRKSKVVCLWNDLRNFFNY